MQGLAYPGDVGCLKAGISFADAITAVGPTCAALCRNLALPGNPMEAST